MAAGLGLLVIIASGILLFVLFSGIDDEVPQASPTPLASVAMVRTPNLMGRAEAEAVRLADRRGVALEIDYVESESVGLVIEQLPDPGMEVSAGTTIQVVVGTQVETVVVPDVHGIREAKALAQLEAAGLGPGVRFSADDRLPAGYVVSTDPRPGDSVTRGSPVDYVVSTGRATGATAVPAGTPRPIATIRPRVNATPFPSQELALVGDFLCLTLADARSHIEAAGLLIGAMIPSDPTPLDSWVIHEQLPKAGEMVPLGSNVDLVLGDPQEACP
jgi:beta-lactam-binding protein with PASTA domain